MGESPAYQAVLVSQDGIKEKSLGQVYYVQVDVEVAEGKTKRVFVDVTNVVTRARAGALPSEGEFYIDSSDDYFEKFGDKG